MSEKCSCSCGCAPTLIFPCSGGSDVGELSDRSARAMTRDGIGSMYCLAGIGGRVPAIIKSTEAAGKIIAVDGCGLSCAAKTLKEAGFIEFVHINLADMGFVKGSSPATDTNVAKVCEKARTVS